MPERGQDFADLVYQIVIAEKRIAAERLAAAMGLAYNAFYARIRNRVSFSADEIRSLISVMPDPRLASYLLRGTRFVPADRVEGILADDVREIHRAATRIVIEATDVLETVEVALTDGRLDHRDAMLVRRDIEIAERALATLREHVRSAIPAGLREEI